MGRENGWRVCVLVLTTAVALCTVRARADATVYALNSGFVPSFLTVAAGEWIYFVAADDHGPCCTQSTNGAWTSFCLLHYGDGFGFRLNQTGNYHYYDTYTQKAGVIRVASGSTNLPPVVSITSPAGGAVFTEPASFTFAAEVIDPENALTTVEFHVGAGPAKTVSSGPFSMQVTNLAAGSYTLIVAAYDAASFATTKSVAVTVQPRGPSGVRLSPPRLVAGQVQFEASGLTVGKQVVLQARDGLGNSASWLPLQTNAVAAATVPFSQPLLPGTKFFRVLQLP